MLFILREQVGVLTNDIKHALKVASRIKVIVCSNLNGVKVISFANDTFTSLLYIFYTICRATQESCVSNLSGLRYDVNR